MNDVTLDRNDAESLFLQGGANQTSTVTPPEENGDITDDTTLITAFSVVALHRRAARLKERSRHHRPSSDRTDDHSVLPKSPSVGSIQSTGSTYYDQLMGSGNIPKVQSISQYGALLAQHVPPK
uniref:Uncharacterized protein n=1 Tax=Tetranychus urticae TaxID=32264 RepID=T1JZH6_TETUR